VVKLKKKEIFIDKNRRFFILEIDDGEDENIAHEDDFLGKLKGKV